MFVTELGGTIFVQMSRSYSPLRFIKELDGKNLLGIGFVFVGCMEFGSFNARILDPRILQQLA